MVRGRVRYCQNDGVPTYAQPPIPNGLVRLVTLGLNQVKLALIVELAQAGGRASTPELLTAIASHGTGVQVPRATALRHLRALQEQGYVSTEEPSREGTTSVWVLHAGHLHQDLRNLISDTTPAKRRTRSR